MLSTPLGPGNKISPKLADFSEKNRKSAGLEKKWQWKNRMGKNRGKIGRNRRKIGDFSESGDFSSCFRSVLCTRVVTDNIADLSTIKSKYRDFSADFRRFFGEFPGPWIFISL